MLEWDHSSKSLVNWWEGHACFRKAASWNRSFLAVAQGGCWAQPHPEEHNQLNTKFNKTALTWLKVIPAMTLLSSSSYLNFKLEKKSEKRHNNLVILHGQQQMPGRNPRPLVVPGSVTSQLQHFGSEVFQNSSKVDCSTFSHSSRGAPRFQLSQTPAE